MQDSLPSPQLVAAPATLEDATRRLETVAEASAAFAHDLKNPLSAILLGVQRLARLADPARQAQALELAGRLERSIQSMTRLLDGHADFSRLQAGQLALERAPLPCAELLDRALAPLRAAAAGRNQALRVQIPAQLPEVVWDANRIVEALEHVVGAALRLAPEGTAVACAAAEDGADVAITLVVERPAAPDLPAPVPGAAPPRRLRGSGLIVARSLVEAHGGRVEIEDDPDRTTLRMSLPARPASAPA